ncbi:TonB family protein [Sphingobium sp. OAS761]|uniref:TonB family protein n=1 Tax=Sphingobium sp. OAS761 TaxID=2817901 RepID=UPI0020A13B95|nr:TonB family protein [Sphingobium sp. OAS761]MCP1471106.1 TonB family protein [Sphingobium sp. OAS761]
MFAVIAGAALLAAGVVAEGETSAVATGQSQTWTEADANKPKMKVAPSFVEGPRAELPESEKALGHHGPVVVQGIIGIDGKMSEARIKLTSNAPVLDQIALAAANASTFTPAKDANGAPLPVVISMPFDLVAYKAPGGMGILQYKCAQFVRDMDWWKSVNPDKSFKDHELYKMEIGFEMLSLIQRARGDQEALRQSIAGFETRWNAAIDFCRKKPNVLQRDAIYR